MVQRFRVDSKFLDHAFSANQAATALHQQESQEAQHVTFLAHQQATQQRAFAQARVEQIAGERLRPEVSAAEFTLVVP